MTKPFHNVEIGAISLNLMRTASETLCQTLDTKKMFISFKIKNKKTIPVILPPIQ